MKMKVKGKKTNTTTIGSLLTLRNYDMNDLTFFILYLKELLVTPF